MFTDLFQKFLSITTKLKQYLNIFCFQFAVGLTSHCPLEEAEVNSVWDAHQQFLESIRQFTHLAFGFGRGNRVCTLQITWLVASAQILLRKVTLSFHAFHPVF